MLGRFYGLQVGPRKLGQRRAQRFAPYCHQMASLRRSTLSSEDPVGTREAGAELVRKPNTISTGAAPISIKRRQRA
jgi:hypothetical protein